MRLAVYGAASTVVAVGVVLSAFNQRANFYSACVYLAQSNACLMVLTNLLVLLSIVFGHGLQLLFYGPLRAMEVEQIYEKAWYAVTETCLAMTIFRDEFDVRFIIMFGILLFVKCFSWIGSGRVEFMEQQPPERPLLFHFRLATSLLILCAACGGMVWHAVTAVLEKGKPSMMVMFAFEFAILLITSTGILSRYVLSLVEKYILYKEASRRKEARVIERAAMRQRRETQREENERRRAAGEEIEEVEEAEEEEDDDEELDVGGWEEKGTWVFYSELCTDFLKLLTYLSFFSIVLTWYGLPLHIIRDVYLTLRSFITRIRDFIRYRRATAHMNSRYPDATADEVGVEGVCIICREEMRPWTEEGAPGVGGRTTGTQDQRHRPKKLPCGHVLHFSCLRSWLERQQRCPTCRRPVLEENAATTANANGRNQDAQGNGPAPQGNGLAFQAQWGFGGLQFGVGAGAGAGAMELMERMQNPGNQQQPQPEVQQPQAQPGAQFPQTPVPQQQPPQNPLAHQAQQGAPGTVASIQQRILHTRRLIDRENAMLENSQRQLQELQQLQAQQDAVNNATASASTRMPATASAVPAPAGLATPTTPIVAPRNYGTPNQLPYHAQPLAPGLPQDFRIPVGWSVIPLTVFGTSGSNVRIPSANPNVLARREHRTYQENMRNYHASRTPTECTFQDVELGGSSNRLGVNRTVSAPASSTSNTMGLMDTSRLIPGQLSSLKPVERESIIALSLFLGNHYNEGRTEYVITVLLGLPEETRKAILAGWPDLRQAHKIRQDTVLMENMYSGGDVSSTARETAVRATASLLLGLSRMERIRVLLGLPVIFRQSVMDRTEEPDSLRLDVQRLQETLANTTPLQQDGISELPQPLQPQGAARAETVTRENFDATHEPVQQRMREAAASLERTAANSPFSVPTPRSFGQGEGSDERLSLFGERSVFSLPAQERTLRSLESDLVDREREFLAQRVVETMLNGEASSSSPPPPPAPTVEEEPEADVGPVDKGKRVDRG